MGSVKKKETYKPKVDNIIKLKKYVERLNKKKCN